MIPSGFSIRPARDDDSEAFLSILAAVFAEYPGCVLLLSEEPEMLRPASSYAEHDGRMWAVERDGVVVGDSTTTTAECAALGGSKQDGRNGWMSHAWVIPGCESPWGVFSAASPLFDRKLTEASGTAATADGPACGASGAAGRYDLRPGTRESVTESVALAGT